ncbi:DUF4383 domain-containing protein [Candidatus Woesearchaeota archaeon]|nr:DUF4383 domain-containing protein [Candidatus Woesearchaeota archaeon]
MADVQKTYAQVIGAVLVLVGIIGFFNNPLLGLFGVNVAQDLLHIIGGAVIVSQAGKTTNKMLGIIGVVVALLGFLPGTDALLASVFGINLATSVLHLVIGIASLGVAYGVKE